MSDRHPLEILLCFLGMLVAIYLTAGFFIHNGLCIEYAPDKKWCVGIHWEPK